MRRGLTRAAQSPAPGRLSDERGSELVEFALASLLFFALIFGILEAGLTVYGYNRLAVVAQEGARYASVRGTRSVGAFNSGGTKSAVTSYLQGLEPAITSVAFNPNVDPNTLAPGATVEVTVSRPLQGNLLVGTWSGTMTATASMRMMR